MKKDAFYFPHFANSRHDRKIMRIRMELGLEGYAIYFMLLEVLREQSDFKYPLDDINVLAHEFGTSEQKVRVVVCNYQLFEVDEESNFFSIKQIYYLQPYIEKTQRARLAAEKRWNKVSDDANAMQMQSKCNADAMQVKESKLKEIKVKESKKKDIHSPTLNEVIDYFTEKEHMEESEKFFNYYESNGWKVGKNPMKNWRAAANNWISNSKKYQKPQSHGTTAKSNFDLIQERHKRLSEHFRKLDELEGRQSVL